jgi:hypothetical protein
LRNRRDVRTDATPLFGKKRKCMYVQAEVNNYTRWHFQGQEMCGYMFVRYYIS